MTTDAQDKTEQEAELMISFLISSAIFAIIAGDKAKQAYTSLRQFTQQLQQASR